MNVYDFDKTIYDGDSTFDFYIYCLKNHLCVWKKVPQVIWYGILFKLGIIEKKKFKSIFFRFAVIMPDLDSAVKNFWSKNKSKIKKFYLEIQRKDDLIISASPEFLLTHICNILGIDNLICTKTDEKTGAITGENCYGEEKVKRFYENGFDKNDVEEFYSDSTSDLPLARLSKKAYIVKKEKLINWEI